MTYGNEVQKNRDPDTTRTDMAAALIKLQQELKAHGLAQQKLEEKIREESRKSLESAKKYQELVEETSDLIARLDRRGHLTFINKAAQALFGVQPDEYFGVSIFRFIHPDDRQKVKQWWNKSLADRASRTAIELRQVSAGTGAVYCLQWSASFHYDDGRMTGIGLIGRDVTAIRRAEQNYENLFSKMLDGFALHEIICRDGKPIDYRFLSVNPAFETLTGLKAEKLLGKTVLEVMPATERHWIDTYGKVALTGEPITFENYSASIDKFFEVAAYSPAPTQVACIFQDITPRKKAEQEKARLEAELRRRHKMEAIGTLAGGIAHDFNNILAAILGYTDMAMEELPAWNPAKNQLKEVMKAGNRARDLVRQILAFSRREEQLREPVNLKALVQEVVVFLRSAIPITIDICLDLDPQCGNILADQTQIHQVLMNICTNASQAMESEGGILSISLKEVRPGEDGLDHTVRLPAVPLVRLDISDTGPGIREEHLDRIFDPYFTTKAFGKGSGMGLAVVHGIVKNHDGLIRVTGNSPRGTCFTLYFPRTEQKLECPALADSRCDPGSERLLVIDDDPGIARMLKTFLEKQGYATTTLCSCRKAFDLFRAGPDSYDLIITDQTMPDMTGEELAEKLLKIRPDIPIVLCTGYTPMIDEMSAKNPGIKACHMKPVALTDLAATVRRLLDEL
jgi:PAS domain S-box-containing protein